MLGVIQVPAKLKIDSQKLQQADLQVKKIQNIKEKELVQALKKAAEDKERVCACIIVVLWNL